MTHIALNKDVRCHSDPVLDVPGTFHDLWEWTIMVHDIGRADSTLTKLRLTFSLERSILWVFMVAKGSSHVHVCSSMFELPCRTLLQDTVLPTLARSFQPRTKLAYASNEAVDGIYPGRSMPRLDSLRCALSKQSVTTYRRKAGENMLRA